MKKVLFFILSAAVLAACAKEYEEQNPVESPVFEAAFDRSTETKIHLNESLLNRWDADDRVTIFVGNTYNQEYKFNGKTGDNSGSFSKVGNPEFFSGEKLSANYAVYPYSSGTAISESGVISVDFPASQSYAEGSFGIGANTMVAVTESTTDNFLLFKNACGYLKLSLYGDATITEITLTGNNGEKIAGAGSITATNSDVPSVTMASSATDSISINCGEGVLLGSESSSATDFYFVIPPIEFTQGITITAVDTEGKVFIKSTSKSISIVRNLIQKMAALEYEGKYVGNISFTDPEFKAYCVQHFDTDGDGEISYDEAAVVRKIDCSGAYKAPGAIASLDGIQYFSSLDSLRCAYNQLTTIDVSKNTALTTLMCNSNQISSIDVSKNTALTYLLCSGNQLTSIDVSKNTALTTLNCGSNQLTSLDVSKNTALTGLLCDQNQLTSIDVSKSTELTHLSCGYNQLTSLDISKNTALTGLSCDKNQLTSLDVSKNTALTGLSCDQNQLTSLDVSNNTDLTVLTCQSNQLTSLDVSKNANLTILYCGSNQLTSLDVSKNTDLTYFACWGNQLTCLDVSKNTALRTLGCHGNYLTSLDVSKNTALINLVCGDNQLTSLDVSKNTALESLGCYSNQLSSIDVSKNTALIGLSCQNNKLTSIDISKNTALIDLTCQNNKLTSIDVSNNIGLHSLMCSPMNDENGQNLLQTVYIYDGQFINFVTSDRSSEYIPDGTAITVKNQ